jgi:hypothetical protein
MITAEYTIPGMSITDHEVPVPLDWSDESRSERITVFAREIVDPVRRQDDLPYLVFLQGGPGGKGPRPTEAAAAPGSTARSSARPATRPERPGISGTSAPTRSSRTLSSCAVPSSATSPGQRSARVTAASSP